MKRSITSSVLVFVISALIGTALNARAEAKGADQDCGETPDVASVYWSH